MAMESSHLLHPELFDRVPVLGAQYRAELACRSEEVATATQGAKDPDVSILIRTRNNEARLEGLLEDIEAQEYNGNKQIVVVDTESTDRTRDIARSVGAIIVPMTQKEFTYPKSLNKGFEAAEHPYVMTLTNRTNLVGNMALKGITRWKDLKDFAGVGGAMVWDEEASIWEAVMTAGLVSKDKRLDEAEVLDEWKPGVMVAHRSVIAKDAWQEVGGYDERFAGGGEDLDLAKRILAAGGRFVRDPALSVHHSHGRLNLYRTVKLALKCAKYRQGEPFAFDQENVRALRPDLALEQAPPATEAA